MQSSPANAPAAEAERPSLAVRLPQAYLSFFGWKLLRLIETVHALGAFSLITLGVLVTKFNTAARVIHPQIRHQITRAGVALLPMTLFIAAALGLVVIGQTVSLLTRVGAHELIGTVMIAAVVRELGPLTAALLVLARVGTATVIELGTTRATGEVEALEALGIDPIHFLVVPRVVGLGLAIFSLTVYLVLGALFSGYLWAFIQDLPLLPGEYFRQLGLALRWEDFALLALKTCCFGGAIALITCFHGLAQPMHLEEVSRATVRAVAQSVIACILIDALFIVVYLVL